MFYRKYHLKGVIVAKVANIVLMVFNKKKQGEIKKTAVQINSPQTANSENLRSNKNILKNFINRGQK
jgi:hypothetical protein